MGILNAPSGREFTLLPIDNSRGVPQSFPVLFNGITYHFRLYLNMAAKLLGEIETFIEPPAQEASLVVKVERENTDATRETIFLRKVVPGLEYETANIALVFPSQRITRDNLNGEGDFGSQVIGGIADRWA